MGDPATVPISKRLVLINSASSIAARLLTIGAFAWVIQYLMKRIPEEEVQLLWIVSAFTLVLPLVQTILNAGLSRHITEAYARGDLLRITQIVSSQFPLLVLGAAIVMLLGIGLAWNIDHLLNISPKFVGKMRFMMMLVVGRFAIGICLAAFNSGLFAKQRFVVQNLIEVGGALLRTIMMLWLILGVGPDIKWVIVAQVSAQVAMLFASTFVSVRLLPEQRFRRSCFRWSICKHVMSFSGWWTLAELGNVIRRAADAPILNLFSTPSAVNDFGLGSFVESRLRDFAIIATQPLAPALTAMHAHGQEKRLSAAYLRGSRIALWASMAMAVPLMVFSYDLYALYLGRLYSEHVHAATVLIILLLGFPLTYPSLMFNRIAFARGEVRQIAIQLFVAQLGNLALTLVLVGKYQWGAIGSATSTLITFAILHPFFQWPLALRMLNLSWGRFFRQTLIPGLVPAVVAAGVGWLSTQFVENAPLMRIAIGFPVCIVCYAICVALALRPADRADLVRIRNSLRRAPL
jgi:O-antigen/teichoic acid export membrane protein